MIDKEILRVEDIAGILGLESKNIRSLLEEGALPGRQISGEWFTTKRQLLEYIENRPAPAPVEVPLAKSSLSAAKFRSHIGTNAWECKSCGAHNEALRAECLTCGYARSVPLIDFTNHGLPKIEIPEELN